MHKPVLTSAPSIYTQARTNTTQASMSDDTKTTHNNVVKELSQAFATTNTNKDTKNKNLRWPTIVGHKKNTTDKTETSNTKTVDTAVKNPLFHAQNLGTSTYAQVSKLQSTYSPHSSTSSTLPQPHQYEQQEYTQEAQEYNSDSYDSFDSDSVESPYHTQDTQDYEGDYTAEEEANKREYAFESMRRLSRAASSDTANIKTIKPRPQVVQVDSLPEHNVYKQTNREYYPDLKEIECNIPFMRVLPNNKMVLPSNGKPSAQFQKQIECYNNIVIGNNRVESVKNLFNNLSACITNITEITDNILLEKDGGNEIQKLLTSKLHGLTYIFTVLHRFCQKFDPQYTTKINQLQEKCERLLKMKSAFRAGGDDGYNLCILLEKSFSTADVHQLLSWCHHASSCYMATWYSENKERVLWLQKKLQEHQKYPQLALVKIGDEAQSLEKHIHQHLQTIENNPKEQQKEHISFTDINNELKSFKAKEDIIAKTQSHADKFICNINLWIETCSSVVCDYAYPVMLKTKQLVCDTIRSAIMTLQVGSGYHDFMRAYAHGSGTKRNEQEGGDTNVLLQGVAETTIKLRSINVPGICVQKLSEVDEQLIEAIEENTYRTTQAIDNINILHVLYALHMAPNDRVLTIAYLMVFHAVRANSEVYPNIINTDEIDQLAKEIEGLELSRRETNSITTTNGNNIICLKQEKGQLPIGSLYGKLVKYGRSQEFLKSIQLLRDMDGDKRMHD